MESPEILIFPSPAKDSEKEFFKRALGEKYILFFVADLQTALTISAKKNPQLIIINGSRAGKETFELLRGLNQSPLGAQLLFLAGATQTELLLSALTLGVSQIMQQPFTAEQLSTRVEQLLARRLLSLGNRKLLTALTLRAQQGDFIGRCNYYNLVITKIEEYCKNLDPVLIIGERGTEKDILAQEIYEHTRLLTGQYFKHYLYDETALDDISFLYNVNNGCLVFEDLAGLDR